MYQIMTTQTIRALLDQALDTLGLPHPDYSINRPANSAFGDYAANLSLILFKQLQLSDQYPSPLKLAEAIVAAIPAQDTFSAITTAPPGFINFTISQPELINSFNQLLAQPNLITQPNTGKTVIVEYSSPNIAKPFTVGHLRSTIIGDAIANIKAATGWRVLRDNHLGDWGTQFGKLICAIKKNWIPFDQIETSANPVKLLVDLYVQFHTQAETDPTLEDEARDWFKKLEQSDPEARDLWQKCIDWSWKEFDRIYQLLGIKFSPELNEGRGLGESFFQDKMQAVIDELDQQQLLKVGDLGAKVVEFGNTYPPLMILKKDGATLYATRDLSTDKYRKDTYQPDCIINEVGAEQSLYFKQLFALEQRLGWFKPEQRLHVGHGMYRFADGKMSTRKGNVIWLEEVITKAIDKSQQFTPNPGLARDIAIGALKWNDLKGEAKRDIVFNWDEILAMKGNSGPYVQYTHARAHSVLTKATDSPRSIDPTASLNSEELELLRWLLRFSETVARADTATDPSLIAGYIYELSQRFNTFYNKHTILGDEITKPQRVSLTELTARTIQTGLHLLGISAPEHM